MNIKGYWIGALVFSLAGNVGAAISMTNVVVENKELQGENKELQAENKELEEYWIGASEGSLYLEGMLEICRNNFHAQGNQE